MLDLLCEYVIGETVGEQLANVFVTEAAVKRAVEKPASPGLVYESPPICSNSVKRQSGLKEVVEPRSKRHLSKRRKRSEPTLVFLEVVDGEIRHSLGNGVQGRRAVGAPVIDSLPQSMGLRNEY